MFAQCATGALLLASMALGGCTQVYTSDGVQLERRGGFLYIQPPETGAGIVELEGLGIMPMSDGLVIGYYNGSVLTLSPDCRAVFWVKTDKQMEALLELLKGRDDLCAAKQPRGGEQ